MKRKKVVSLNINVGTYIEIVQKIISLPDKKKSSYVCVSNVHMVIEAYKNLKFLKLVNNADLIVADGMPLVKAMRLLYNIRQERVAGMDLMPELIKKCAENKKKIFLYGSTDDILNKIEKKASKEYPLLEIKTFSPPFKELNNEEKEKIRNMIKMINPDFIFVALGCPKQEKWMAENKNKINSCMIGLGGAFEVYAGTKNRAPLWMQNYSLEWLFRLFQDPKRLWKRYFTTNSLFLILLFFQIIKIKVLKKGD